MSPDQIAALTAVASIISKVGTWPIGSIIAGVVFGPWVAMFFLNRSQERRHEAAVQMYKDNVQLVKEWEKVAKGLQDIVVLTTQTMTRVQDSVEANLYCPLMRKDPKVEKTVEKPQ